MENRLETKNNNIADKANSMFSTGYGSLLFTSKGIENFRKRYDSSQQLKMKQKSVNYLLLQK